MSAQEAPTDLDNAVVLRVPLELRKRGGRKQIIVPDPHAPPHPPLVLALARAHHWLDLLEQGRYATVTDLARALGVDRAYVNRHLRLTCLAPDIVERILAGDEPSGLSLRKLDQPLPSLWTEQRDHLGHLATRC